MMDSILDSVKKKLGILPDYKTFDEEIIMDINTAFFILNQLGVGPDDPFVVEDDLATWDDFIAEPSQLRIVRSYIPLEVKLLFDPPSSAYLLENIKEKVSEYEFRMAADAEKTKLRPPVMDDIYVQEEG